LEALLLLLVDVALCFFIQQIVYSQAKNMLLILAEGEAVCGADVPVKARW